MYSSYGPSGDGVYMNKSLCSWNPLCLPNSVLNPALWRYRRRLNVQSQCNFYKNRQNYSALNSRIEVGFCTLNELIEKPMSALKPRIFENEMANGNTASQNMQDQISTDRASNISENLSMSTSAANKENSQKKSAKWKQPKNESERLFLERFQKLLDKTVLLYDDLYQKKGIGFSYSRDHYQSAMRKLLEKSRKFFFQLESKAIRELLITNKTVDSSTDLEQVFHHDYLTMSDSLAMHLLQLILAYSDCGFLCVDQAEPLSLASFYRGEFRLGQATAMSGVYQIHVQSYQYTTLTNFLQLNACPLQSVNIGHHRQSKRSSELENLDMDIFDRAFSEGKSPHNIRDVPMTSEEIEDTSQYLKIVRWHVCFKQNPDQEDESYFLCCKAIKPHFQAPEYIFQSDSVNYYLGRYCSPKMNFQNPSMEEIILDCRPVGRFEVLHSFGVIFPKYNHAMGVLVNYLRHKRFNRTIF